MKRKMYWGFLILIVLIGVGGVLFIRHNLSQISKYERDAAEAENLKQDQNRIVGKTGVRVSDTTATYQPPPLGETEDTGYWEGNTWHQKTAPKAKKRGLWSEDPDKLAYQMKYDVGLTESETIELARRIVRDYPYSDAALEARYRLMRVDGKSGYVLDVPYLKGMLKYYPNSTRVLTNLAQGVMKDSPEEAIAFGKKSLRIDPSDDSAHLALGRAYQFLGDYKTALVHLKSAKKFRDPDDYGYISAIIDGKRIDKDYDIITHEILMIEAGTPRFGPDPEPSGAFSTDVGISGPSSVPASSPDLDSMFDPSDLPELPTVDERVVDPAVPSLRDAAVMRAREAAEAERLASVREQQRKEFASFLRWMDTIETAKSPADLEDFLMREMATQLRGGSSEFTPDRLIRAFETMEQHGEAAGLRALEKLDADLARKLLRERPKQRMPPGSPK